MQSLTTPAVSHIHLPTHLPGALATHHSPQNKSRIFKSIDESGKSDKTKHYRQNHRDGGNIDDFA